MFLPLFFPKPEEEGSRALVKGKNERGEDKPGDVEMRNKEKNEAGQTSQGGEDRGKEQEERKCFFQGVNGSSSSS